MIPAAHDVESRQDQVATRTGTSGAVPAPRTPAPAADRPGRPRSGAAALVVSRGPAQGAVFTLSGATTVLGRHRDCDIVLSDVTVSRYHTEIVREGDRYFVVDAGSLNGTYLNRQVVDRAELSDGDEIWVGKVRFRFSR